MRKVSIGIVTYNNEDKIEELLKSLYHYTKDIDFDIYVVDNNSSDKTIEIINKNYPDVHVLSMTKNLGFGLGHNQLLSIINSDYHLILNPDIRFISNAIKDLSMYLDENPDVVMVTPKILNQDGTEQYLPKEKPSLKYLLSGKLSKYSRYFNKLRDRYTRKDCRNGLEMEIDFATGCFSLIRTEVFKGIEGFDDRFFMYLEDADLTLRAKSFGKIIFYPYVSVVHMWERASSKSLKFLLIHIHSMKKFLIKWSKKEFGGNQL